MLGFVSFRMFKAIFRRTSKVESYFKIHVCRYHRRTQALPTAVVLYAWAVRKNAKIRGLRHIFVRSRCIEDVILRSVGRAFD